jgi:hypothetical protein
MKMRLDAHYLFLIRMKELSDQKAHVLVLFLQEQVVVDELTLSLTLSMDLVDSQACAHFLFLQVKGEVDVFNLCLIRL